MYKQTITLQAIDTLLTYLRVTNSCYNKDVCFEHCMSCTDADDQSVEFVYHPNKVFPSIYDCLQHATATTSMGADSTGMLERHSMGLHVGEKIMVIGLDMLSKDNFTALDDLCMGVLQNTSYSDSCGVECPPRANVVVETDCSNNNNNNNISGIYQRCREQPLLQWVMFEQIDRCEKCVRKRPRYRRKASATSFYTSVSKCLKDFRHSSHAWLLYSYPHCKDYDLIYQVVS